MFNAFNDGTVLSELNPLERPFAVIPRGIQRFMFIGIQSSQLIEHILVKICLPPFELRFNRGIREINAAGIVGDVDLMVCDGRPRG